MRNLVMKRALVGVLLLLLCACGDARRRAPRRTRIRRASNSYDLYERTKDNTSCNSIHDDLNDIFGGLTKTVDTCAARCGRAFKCDYFAFGNGDCLACSGDWINKTGHAVFSMIEHEIIDVCAANPCRNATCTNDIYPDFFCVCPKNFRGIQCETEIRLLDPETNPVLYMTITVGVILLCTFFCCCGSWKKVFGMGNERVLSEAEKDLWGIWEERDNSLASYEIKPTNKGFQLIDPKSVAFSLTFQDDKVKFKKLNGLPMEGVLHHEPEARFFISWLDNTTWFKRENEEFQSFVPLVSPSMSTTGGEISPDLPSQDTDYSRARSAPQTPSRDSGMNFPFGQRNSTSELTYIDGHQASSSTLVPRAETMKFWMRFPAKCLQNEDISRIYPAILQKQKLKEALLKETRDLEVEIGDIREIPNDPTYVSIMITATSTDFHYLQSLFTRWKQLIESHGLQRPEDDKDIFSNAVEIHIDFATDAERPLRPLRQRSVDSPFRSVRNPLSNFPRARHCSNRSNRSAPANIEHPRAVTLSRRKRRATFAGLETQSTFKQTHDRISDVLTNVTRDQPYGSTPLLPGHNVVPSAAAFESTLRRGYESLNPKKSPFSPKIAQVCAIICIIFGFFGVMSGLFLDNFLDFPNIADTGHKFGNFPLIILGTVFALFGFVMGIMSVLAPKILLHRDPVYFGTGFISIALGLSSAVYGLFLLFLDVFLQLNDEVYLIGYKNFCVRTWMIFTVLLIGTLSAFIGVLVYAIKVEGRYKISAVIFCFLSLIVVGLMAYFPAYFPGGSAIWLYTLTSFLCNLIGIALIIQKNCSCACEETGFTRDDDLDE